MTETYGKSNRQTIEQSLVFIELKNEVSERLELPQMVPVLRQDLDHEVARGQIPPSMLAAGIEALKILKPDLDHYDRFLARYYLMEGQKALEQEDFFQAQRYYQKALELNQSELSAEAAFYLARLVSFTDSDKAILLYQDSLRLNRNSAPAHFELALLFRERRDLQGALSEFEAAYRLDSSSASLLNEIGDTQVMADNLESAKIAYKRSMEIAPEYWVLPVKLGITEYNLDDFSSAIQSLRLGLDMAPEELDTEFTTALYIEGLYYLGLAHRESGKTAQARKIFRAVLNIVPDHPAALEALSQLL